jgi:hypothetical protein
MPPAPNIKGKNGVITLKAGGVGAVSHFSIAVDHPPPVGSTTIKLTGTTGTWDAIEAPPPPPRLPKPPAAPTRVILHIQATQKTVTRPAAAGDTDDITVTVTNSTIPTDTDKADMDAIFA